MVKKRGLVPATHQRWPSQPSTCKIWSKTDHYMPNWKCRHGSDHEPIIKLCKPMAILKGQTYQRKPILLFWQTPWSPRSLQVQAPLYRHQETLQPSSPTCIPMSKHLTVSTFFQLTYLTVPSKSERVTGMMEQVSTIISDVVSLKCDSFHQTYSVTKTHIRVCTLRKAGISSRSDWA